jgi:methylthioribose-1-phosphate isomerase
MKVNSKHYHTVWYEDGTLKIIDQTKLPHAFVIKELHSVKDVITAIEIMEVRGAPAIGVTGAFGVWLASKEALAVKDFEPAFDKAVKEIRAARPTAVNLAWAVDRAAQAVKAEPQLEKKVQAALATAQLVTNEELESCKQIGLQGVKLIEEIAQKKNGRPVNIMTHCNAGWLACVDYGTATAPIYEACERGLKVHVWVSETRPRSQGFNLTAFELGQHCVPHTLLVDNAAGILMQRGLVDLVIVGCDRASRTCDAANKVGTYLKALAARDNGVPFYVALPSSSVDWSIGDGVKEIEIEERNTEEVLRVTGLGQKGIESVLVAPSTAKAINFGFDVTPSRLVTGFILERGICPATEEGLLKLFPEKRRE